MYKQKLSYKTGKYIFALMQDVLCLLVYNDCNEGIQKYNYHIFCTESDLLCLENF